MEIAPIARMVFDWGTWPKGSLRVQTSRVQLVTCRSAPGAALVGVAKHLPLSPTDLATICAFPLCRRQTIAKKNSLANTLRAAIYSCRCPTKRGGRARRAQRNPAPSSLGSSGV